MSESRGPAGVPVGSDSVVDDVPDKTRWAGVGGVATRGLPPDKPGFSDHYPVSVLEYTIGQDSVLLFRGYDLWCVLTVNTWWGISHAKNYVCQCR